MVTLVFGSLEVGINDPSTKMELGYPKKLLNRDRGQAGEPRGDAHMCHFKFSGPSSVLSELGVQLGPTKLSGPKIKSSIICVDT